MFNHFKRMHRNLIAIKRGQKIFYIKDLKRICLASNKKQCESKFMKHKVTSPSLFLIVMYILFNMYGRKNTQTNNWKG